MLIVIWCLKRGESLWLTSEDGSVQYPGYFSLISGEWEEMEACRPSTASLRIQLAQGYSRVVFLCLWLARHSALFISHQFTLTLSWTENIPLVWARFLEMDSCGFGPTSTQPQPVWGQKTMLLSQPARKKDVLLLQDVLCSHTKRILF